MEPTASTGGWSPRRWSPTPSGSFESDPAEFLLPPREGLAYLPYMQLMIDGQEAAWDAMTLRTFGSVVQEATRRAAAEGRIVHRLEVDGREISTRLEQEMAGRPVEEIGQVRVHTTTPGALLNEALDGAIELSRALRHDIRKVLSFMGGGDIPAAQSLYVSCVESLGTFFQLAGAVFNGIRSGAFPLPTARPGGGGELPEPPAATTEVLQRLLKAQKEEDWQRMADLLENEISPNLEEWSGFFSAMRGSGQR
jgi:hypothetical protein